MKEKNCPGVFDMGNEMPEMFAKFFTGQAYFQPLNDKGGPIANVTFEPGCPSKQPRLKNKSKESDF